MPIQHSIEENNAYAVVHVNENVTPDNATDFIAVLVDLLTKFATGPRQGVILNFSSKHEFDHTFLKDIAPVAKVVKDNSSHLILLNVPAPSIKLVKASGMDGMLTLVLTMDKALSIIGVEAPRPPAKIDVAFINPFIDGTIKTLTVQCQVEVTPGNIFLKGSQPAMDIAIAAVLGLTSAPFNGSVALCFPEATFLAIMSKMLGETFSSISKDLEDGAGELLNIIFGSAKAELNKLNYAIEKAIPTVVRGQDLAIRHMTTSPTVVLPFQTSVGPFQIEIGTEPNTLK